MNFESQFAGLVCVCFFILDICCAPSALNYSVDKDDSSSEDRRYLLDQQPTTHFSSELQRIACATTCIETYKNITESCCHTGDNRICYDLLRYTDVLKTYVGRCLGTTAATVVPHHQTSSLSIPSSSTTNNMSYNHTKAPTAVNGGWSTWQTWEQCSVTCGTGTKTRTRLCNNPKPEFGGATCIGTLSETDICLEKYCPVDGGWTEWTPWSPCFASNMQRFRDCSNPTPNYGGSYCTGEPVEAKSCSLGRTISGK